MPSRSCRSIRWNIDELIDMGRKKKKTKNNYIPESLGNMICGVLPHVISLLLNAAIHMTIFIVYGAPVQQLWRFVLSFFFFIYPFSYVTDILWSLRPSVRAILSGEILINRLQYMNAARREVEASQLLPVTVSIPVYMEENEVIFETIRQSLAAIASYREYSSREANVLVSEDGLAPLMGGKCGKEDVERLLVSFREDPGRLSPEEKKAASRILFYREQGVGFIARPAKGRAGLFKKASNLNYTMRYGDLAERGMIFASAEAGTDLLASGYAEGDCHTHEIILLLDKDSGVSTGIIEAVAPEFAYDEKLAYVQCATNAINLNENYYSRATGYQTNELFHYTWPCRSLQGFFVPLVGHNVFVRKSILEKCGRWSENKVSEDFDMAIRFYGMGYHGKYAKIPGLEFTEYTSTTFEEETGKQRRYSYGLFEMMFEGTVQAGRTRSCDFFFMVLYFFSVINQVLLLPTVFFECYFGNIHLLWAGFLVCDACFILLPWIRGLVMRRSVPREHRPGLLYTVEVATSFVSHSLSVLSGLFTWILNKFKEKKKSFPSTKVGENERGFLAGLKLILGYIQGTWLFVPVCVLCVDRCIYVMSRRGIGIESRIAYCFIFFSMILAPLLFTPSLFASGAAAGSHERNRKGAKNQPNNRRWIMDPSIPAVVESDPEVALDDDVAAFLKGYEENLADELAEASFPEEITDSYSVIDCLKKEDDGKKETYFLKRRSDGLPAILRITRDYTAEDALEEAKMLQRLDHPGIPKVYASFEKNDRHYMIREYIEGKSLDRIIQTKGPLSEDDVFDVTMELTGILKYLHNQTPPVIHRDIKPQNIVLGKDGSINLIDFGIARVHKPGRSQDTAIVLTMDYAPPEQYGFDQSSPLTDIYALGVVMLFMATGQATKPALGSEIVSNTLRNLIQRCIAFDPHDRIQNVEEIEKIIRHNAKKKDRRFLRIAAAAAAAGLVVFASYAAGDYFGAKSGSASGYRTGYDEGYVEGYQDVPVFSLGEKMTHPEDGNLPVNTLCAGGAYAVLYDNVVYYIRDGDIYRMTADGTDMGLFIGGKQAAGLCAYNGWLYYSSGRDIIQVNVYTGENNITYGGTEGYLTVLDSDYYIVTGEDVFSFDLSDWSLTSVGASFVADYARKGISDEVTEHVRKLDPVMCSYESRGIVMLDKYDSLIWNGDPEGTIRNRVTRNRARDFNLAGEWIFYHNLDDQDNLWCVRRDGADDHRV